MDKARNIEDIKANAELIFEGGVDLTFIDPTLMEIQSCMAARYDAGVVKHRKEHTGVIEVWKINSKTN